jgi:mycothiol synthase
MGELAVVVQPTLQERDVENINQLIRICTNADSAHPFSENVVLHLRHGHEIQVRHLLAFRSGELVGYAHLDLSDRVQGPSAELAVHPDFRRHGVGRALLAGLIAESGAPSLRLWSHGESTSASALAHAFGFERTRTLWQMRRSLFAAVPEAVVPAGITFREFDVETDIPQWLECNARAFADHPEQGRWTEIDFSNRMTEKWFDPKGFIVAVDENQKMVGFHWTKIHPKTTNQIHEHEAIGEVYVVGVDPTWQGKSLGKALTIAGLKYLRDQGLNSAMLYVDSADERAINLYSNLGFMQWDSDTLFRFTIPKTV